MRLGAGQSHKAEFPVVALDTLIGQALTLFLTSLNIVTLTNHSTLGKTPVQDVKTLVKIALP